ncbi:DUF3866 family protein [Coriobacteriia bacterium Es71-Z0120]|uniref:DUF3866 family protein n=1 Tax=Parvivirga hydrogeniphila TaxID=2939460 RepID=UPI002260B9D6|nr:DUF3866 family protein [Parvivirga hydrogeniphila]MCL4079124.1 DUF3866 family protein [Parvivirga hydrogeniphila]
MRLAWGEVVEVLETRLGLQRLAVRVDGRDAVAVCLPSLTGACAAGDRVLLNTTAVDLDLGTGGAHFIVARDDERGFSDASGGHIMKLRYTPLQRDVLAVEEQASEHAEALRDADDLGGVPVVCCPLHSHVLPVAAAIKEGVPDARVVYVMADDAALPLAISDAVAQMRAVGLLDGTVTTGHAFGGDLEAVTLHSGLLAAVRVLSADAVVAAIGPGVPGTGSVFGHGGVAAGEAINAVAALRGAPVAALRISFADPRERHRGVSHHSFVALGRVALARARVAVPRLEPPEADVVERALESAGIWERHERVIVDARMPDTRGVPMRSMGRSPHDDPVFFLAAAAAGSVAASLIRRPRRSRA